MQNKANIENRPAVNVAQGGRWLQAIVGCCLLLFLGLIYAWSIFVPYLQAEFSWTRSQLSLAFTICMCMFCIGGFISGLLSKRFSCRFLLRICAVLVLVGFSMASRINSLTGIYICYGGFVGFGVGMAYNTLINTIVKWFPDKTGLISGMLLMGFGLGGMVLGTACTALMESAGWRSTFMGIAVVYGVLVFAGSFVIKAAPAPAVQAKEASQSEDFTTRGMLATKTFWIFFAWATILSSAGLALISNASPIAMDMGLNVSTAAVYAGLISLFNGLGRMIVGAIFDKIGRKYSMTIVSIGFILAGGMLMAAQQLSNTSLLVAGFILTGFSYGGVMPCNSTVISRFFGREHYAMNFSMINMNVMIASPLGPMLASGLQGSSGSYFTTFAAILAFGVCALLLNILIRKPQKD